MNRPLDERLRAEKPVRQPTLGFASRVMEQVAEGSSISIVEPLHTRGRLFPAFVLAGAAAILGTVFLLRQMPARQQQLNAGGFTAEGSISVAALSPVSAGELREIPAKIDAPLQEELDRMIADTRSAMQFLASNFLPEGAQQLRER